jgi:hypothetical protein
MKKFIVLGFLLFGAWSAKAQITQDIPDHTPMMNQTWELINKLMYKITEKGNETVYTPFFPPDLKAIDNKIVELPGYLVPLNSGRTHETFMLSVLPIMQCMFCGTNDIPPMVEIFMKKGKAVKFTEDPIRIRGRVHLNSNTLKGNSEIQILDAEIIPN